MTLHTLTYLQIACTFATLITSHTVALCTDTFAARAVHELVNTALCYYDVLHEAPSYQTPLTIELERVAKHPVRMLQPLDKRAWRVDVFIAGDNDLFRFALKNLQQLQQVGSGPNLHIFVRFDYHQPGRAKETRYLYIEKNKILQIGDTLSHDSGDVEALKRFADTAHQFFPAERVAVVFWNHGSGDLNPLRSGLNPAELFTYNAANHLIELRRDIPFSAFLAAIANPLDRGICFDETTGNYLNDEKLITILRHMYELRGKQPIDILILDACMGAGIGMAHIAHPYARYMTASEEVVLGPGYNYTLILERLAQESLTPRDFARHIVSSYHITYNRITRDFTESALDLSKYPALERNLDELGRVLAQGLRQNQGYRVRNAVAWSRNRERCTTFQERSYVDIGHFYKNLLQTTHDPSLLGAPSTKALALALQRIIQEGLIALSELVIANVTGENLKHATGVYFYLPEDGIHGSYGSTAFAQQNSWFTFLQEYFKLHRKEHEFVDELFSHSENVRTENP